MSQNRKDLQFKSILQAERWTSNVLVSSPYLPLPLSLPLSSPSLSYSLSLPPLPLCLPLPLSVCASLPPFLPLPQVYNPLSINYPFTAFGCPFTTFCWNWDCNPIRDHGYCWSQYYFNWTYLCKVIGFWMWLMLRFIAHSTYSTCKLQTCRISGLVCTMPWNNRLKYVYNNLLQTISPVHSVATHLEVAQVIEVPSQLWTHYWGYVNLLWTNGLCWVGHIMELLVFVDWCAITCKLDYYIVFLSDRTDMIFQSAVIDVLQFMW